MQLKLERDYQAGLVDRLGQWFPGAWIQKQDTRSTPGIPDLLILFGRYWFMLEVKRKKPTKASDFEPNQEWYIAEFNTMAPTFCIYPENEEEVLREIQQALRA